jgi:uncharacterized membrane protein
MKTMTVGLAALLVIGLVAAIPTASAAPVNLDNTDTCYGVYKEYPNGTKECTGVWQHTLEDLLDG